MKKYSLLGFTLIELLVVIAIIIILSVVGMVVFSNVKKVSQDSRKKVDVDAIAKALEVHFDPAIGLYPQIQDSWFSSGIIPIPPDPTSYVIKPSIFPSITGFEVCATLSDSSLFCKKSSQAVYIALASPPPSPPPSGTPNPSGSPTQCLNLANLPTLVRNDFLLNATIAGNQDHLALSRTNNGNFIATWMGTHSTDADAVILRTFDPIGTPLNASDVRINITTAGMQQNSQTDTDGDTRAVFVWTNGSSACVSSCDSVAKVYLNNIPLTGEIPVNLPADRSDPEPHPNVTMIKSGIYKGYFIVSWNDTNDATYEFKNYIRVYQPNGTAYTSPIQINQSSSIASGALLNYIQSINSARQFGYTRVAANLTGDVVAVWERAGDQGILYYRRFNPFTGVYQPEQIVNTLSANVFSQHDPTIFLLDSGSFVISWWETPSASPGNDLQSSIYAKIFYADLTTSSRINLPSNPGIVGYSRPDVKMLSTGGFISAWNYHASSSEADIFMRAFLANGTPYQNDIPVSTIAGKQWRVALDFLEDASCNLDLVIAWDSNQDAGQGTNAYSRLYQW